MSGRHKMGAENIGALFVLYEGIPFVMRRKMWYSIEACWPSYGSIHAVPQHVSFIIVEKR